MSSERFLHISPNNEKVCCHEAEKNANAQKCASSEWLKLKADYACVVEVSALEMVGSIQRSFTERIQ